MTHAEIVAANEAILAGDNTLIANRELIAGCNAYTPTEATDENAQVRYIKGLARDRIIRLENAPA